MLPSRQHRLIACDQPSPAPRFALAALPPRPVLRTEPRPTPPPPIAPSVLPKRRRHLAPAFVVAIAAHCAVALVLATIPLRYAYEKIKLASPSVRFTFVGLADPGGTPNAGGRTALGGVKKSATPSPAPTNPPTPQPKIVERPAPKPPPPISQPRTPPPPQPIEPPIAVIVKNAPADRVIAATPPAPQSIVTSTGTSSTDHHAVLVGDAPQAGTGIGTGTGNGVGDGNGSGAAGSGGTGPGGSSGNALAHPDYLHSPKPRYPAVARQSGWEGTTILRVEVLTTGAAGKIQIVESSGHRILDDAALDSVRAARFQPARAAGVPTNSWVEIPISFRLHRG